MSRLWPIAEPAQAYCEQLREIVLAGGEVGDLLAARRFERRGLAGLISWPTAEPAYPSSVIGAPRVPWCGTEDPRAACLCDTYAFLLGRDTDSQRLQVLGQEGRALRARVD